MEVSPTSGVLIDRYMRILFRGQAGSAVNTPDPKPQTKSMPLLREVNLLQAAEWFRNPDLHSMGLLQTMAQCHNVTMCVRVRTYVCASLYIYVCIYTNTLTLSLFSLSLSLSLSSLSLYIYI